MKTITNQVNQFVLSIISKCSVNVKQTKLSEADIARVDFLLNNDFGRPHHVNPTVTNLSGANLSCANLECANLSCAELKGEK